MEKIYDFCWKILQNILPTKPYLSLKYRVIFKKRLNWSQPESFNEKLQWLKLYGYRDEYTMMVDKILVKDYVASIIGDEYIIPTIGIWSSAEEIDFDSLDTKCIIKCNHDSGTVAVYDKECDRSAIVKKMRKALHTNYYLSGREKPYKFVKRKVFAEKFISPSEGEGEISDYKFFCFDGEPKLFKINFDRATDFRANYYDTRMNLLPFGEVWPSPDHSRSFAKPAKFEKMLEICRALSKDIPFVRVDLYNVDGKIYFGELTFYPTSGFGPFDDWEWDKKMGSMIKLPKR